MPKSQLEQSQAILNKLLAKQDLDTAEAVFMMDFFMGGELPAEMTAALLIALRAKGEAVAEIVGCAKSMRSHMQNVVVNDAKYLTEIVGTGGDGSSLFNVSTASTFVIVASGAKVAKHFNYSNSSKSGGANFLETAGANLKLSHEQVATILQKTNLGFMFAPMFHPAMKFVVPVRKLLATRTIFNLLGPLTNPAGVKNIVLGVFDSNWQMPMAQALQQLGCNNAWVVHTAGTDELMVNSINNIVELKQDKITQFSLDARDFGLKEHSIEAMQVASPEESVAIITAILAGDNNAPGFATVVLNAAAGLLMSGICNDIKQAIDLATNTLTSGQAKALLATYIEQSNFL